MGNWQLTIKGTGPHHNTDCADDADRIATEALKNLIKAGHRVSSAEFTVAVPEDLNARISGNPTPLYEPKVAAVNHHAYLAGVGGIGGTPQLSQPGAGVSGCLGEATGYDPGRPGEVGGIGIGAVGVGKSLGREESLSAAAKGELRSDQIPNVEQMAKREFTKELVQETDAAARGAQQEVEDMEIDKTRAELSERSEIPPHVERMINEAVELRIKIDCLTWRISSFNSAGNPVELMQKQLSTMVDYLKVLDERIAAVWPIGYQFPGPVLSSLEEDKESLQAEEASLINRLRALRRFITENPIFQNLSKEEKSRMRQQAECMTQYAMVLQDRVTEAARTEKSVCEGGANKAD